MILQQVSVPCTPQAFIFLCQDGSSCPIPYSRIHILSCRIPSPVFLLENSYLSFKTQVCETLPDSLRPGLELFPLMSLLGPPFLTALTPLVRNYLFTYVSESLGIPGSGTACAKAQM